MTDRSILFTQRVFDSSSSLHASQMALSLTVHSGSLTVRTHCRRVCRPSRQSTLDTAHTSTHDLDSSCNQSPSHPCSTATRTRARACPQIPRGISTHLSPHLYTSPHFFTAACSRLGHLRVVVEQPAREPLDGRIGLGAAQSDQSLGERRRQARLDKLFALGRR